MSLLHELEGKWRLNASYCDKDGLVAKVLCRCADELAAAIAAGDGAVAQLTTFEDTNSFSARMHDVVHDLPPGTYNLYLHPAGAVEVDEAMISRAREAFWEEFPEEDREPDWYTWADEQVRMMLTAALNPGGSRE